MIRQIYRAAITVFKGGFLFPLAIFIFFCSSCGRKPLDPQWKEVSYTLMSYNVGSFMKYADELGRFSYPEVADVIETVQPQVIGLQETDFEGKRTNYDRQVDSLARLLGDSWQARFYYAGYTWYGNGLLWNNEKIRPLVEFDRVALEKISGNETRSMGAVEYEDFVFIVTHLDNKSLIDRTAAVDTITSWTIRHYANSEKPVFLAGDMNARPTAETIERIRENWSQLTSDSFTFSTDDPVKCLDYIFLFKNDSAPLVTCMDSGVVLSEMNPAVTKASDHFPIYVTVSWRVPLSP